MATVRSNSMHFIDHEHKRQRQDRHDALAFRMYSVGCCVRLLRAFVFSNRQLISSTRCLSFLCCIWHEAPINYGHSIKMCAFLPSPNELMLRWPWTLGHCVVLERPKRWIWQRRRSKPDGQLRYQRNNQFRIEPTIKSIAIYSSSVYIAGSGRTFV